MDPLADDAPNWTPFRFGFDNPIKYNDPNGMFEIDDKTAENHPEFAEFLKGLVDIWNNKSKEFRSDYLERSGLTNEEVVDMLTYGKGPKLTIENLDTEDTKINGLTGFVTTDDEKKKNPFAGKGWIKLDDDVVGLLEKGYRDSESDLKAAPSFLAETVLLHEGLHYGSIKKTGDANGLYTEVGDEWERSAYGKKPTRRTTVERMEDIKKDPSPRIPSIKPKSIQSKSKK